MSASYEEGEIQTVSRNAEEAIARGQPVISTSTGGVVVAGNGELADFFAMAAAASGASCPCALPGQVVPALSDGVLAAGVRAASDASGEIVAAATGDYVLGKFLETGAADTLSAFLFSPSSIEP